MFELEKIIRPNIKQLVSYSSARKEYKGNEGVFLDANENPFGCLNRYPDPKQSTLRALLSKRDSIPADQIFIGNGSDEIIDLVCRIFCIPNNDAVLSFSPSFGMYEVVAAMNDLSFIKVPLDQNWNIPYDQIKHHLSNENLKLIFLCSPNNPTGNLMNGDVIENILQNFNGIVFLDEAYIDFCDAPSWKNRLSQYPNLIVSQTMSKAWGLASSRIGIAYASKAIIDLFNKIKLPYSISTLNQNAATNALRDTETFQKNLEYIREEKVRVFREIKKIKTVLKVFPSHSNFFLIKVENAQACYDYLSQNKIIVRNRNSIISNALRITIGTKDENNSLIQALKDLQ